MKHFFETYPLVLEQCRNANSSICGHLPSAKVNEISFDLILPFLFEDIEKNEAQKLSFELCVHREIVDIYNKGDKEVDELIKLSEMLTPVSYEEYQQINAKSRNFNGNLLKSYLQATERVYYRFLLLEHLNKIQTRKNEIKRQVEKFSAFLLFDDDVYDLENDFASGKKTTLTEFLNADNSLQEGIAQMTTLIDNDSTLFGIFTANFKNIYSHG